MPAETSGTLYVAEPGGRYTPQPPLVVDCSVLAAVLFDEPERESAALTMAGKELFAPDLLDHALVSVALKKSRLGLTRIAEQALEDLAQIRLTRCAVNARTQLEMAEKLNLTAYDAAYVLLAADLAASLVTFDRTLGLAAKEVLYS